MKICPVILCGGIGTRLWPASQDSLPKQFLKFNSPYSLFQETILRVTNNQIFSQPLIICNEKFKFRTASDLEEINIDPLSIIVEPEQRNTAPAITAATLFLQKHHPELKNILVLSSDHYIQNKKQFLYKIEQLNSSNIQNFIVTFGITPDHPSTGYGYIKQGKKINDTLYEVKSFIEKPDQKTADILIKDKNIVWNSGIFFFQGQTLLQEISKYKPDIYKYSKKAVANITHDKYFYKLDKNAFSQCENISIDYAVLEKTNIASVFPLNIQWNDLGTWQSIHNITKKDKHNNAILGDQIHTTQTDNCLIYSDNKQITSVAHRVKDLNIVITDSVVLVSNKHYPEEIKEVYKQLKNKNIITEPSLEYRPWGYYKNILTTTNYKVKLLSINPNSQISLQYHHQRAEHWVITKGTASITIGNTLHTLERDQSIYVPKHEVHKIENKTNSILEIIEVQIGNYLGEDDIVRLEDKYNRT